MLSVALLELKYQGLAGSLNLPNLASATDIIPLGTLLGTSNLLKMLKRHTDCMQVHCTVCRHPILARICRSQRAARCQKPCIWLARSI